MPGNKRYLLKLKESFLIKSDKNIFSAVLRLLTKVYLWLDHLAANILLPFLSR